MFKHRKDDINQHLRYSMFLDLVPKTDLRSEKSIGIPIACCRN